MVINKIVISTVILSTFWLSCGSNTGSNNGVNFAKKDSLTNNIVELKDSAFQAKEIDSLINFDYSGDWELNSEDGTEVFTLKIMHDIENDKIIGTHCFVADDGGRIDCPIDEKYTFKGNLIGNFSRIMLKSDFSEDSLDLHVKFIDDKHLILNNHKDIGFTLFYRDMEFEKSE